MKLYIVSDLHLEFENFEPQDADADIIVLAGDVHVGTKGLKWITDHFAAKPVIYVPGNHEYYSHAIPTITEKLIELTKGTNIHILNNEALTIDNVTFLGSTLWTDFNLFSTQARSGLYAQLGMSDFHLIRINPGFRKLKWTDILEIHRESLQWIADNVNTKQNNQFVIVTHHLPTLQSVARQFKDDDLTPAFASNLDYFVALSEAKLWIHGHTHIACDYQLASTRIVCNPKGYPGEKTNFNPNKIVDI